MSAWQIPLSGIHPQFESPEDAQAKQLSLKQMAQANQIQLQQQQENALKLKAAQREQDAQDALNGALSENTSIDPADGTIKVNHGAVLKHLADKGYAGEALKYDAVRRADVTNALDSQLKQFDVYEKQGSALGKLAGAVPTVDWTEKDPDVLQRQKTAAAAVAKQSLDQAIKIGALPPEVGQQMEAHLSDYSPDVEAQIQAFAKRNLDQVKQAQLLKEQHQDLREQLLLGPDVDIKKTQAAKEKQDLAAQNIGKVKSQSDLDKFIADNPGVPGLPTTYTPEAITAFQTQGVATKDQPKFETDARNAAALKAMTPADWDAKVDSVIPPTGTRKELNQATKTLVHGYIQRGLPDKAEAIIKDAYDQVGRTQTAVDTAKATAPIKINLATAEQNAKDKARLPGDDAVDLMAEELLNGKTPSSKNPILYAQVYKRAAELAKERGLTNQQVILERNAAGANKIALNAVNKQYETLKPFAAMAEKNADILEQKSKLVSDLGASILNTPLRDLESNFTGNTNVAAFRAALMPVQADFARILNSPTGGGVLSDDSRREMSKAIKPGATVGEIKAALDVFRNDARNRKEGYEASIKDLTERSVAGGDRSKTNDLPKGNGARIDKATAKKFYDAAGGDPKKAQKLAEDNNWKVQ